MRSRAIRQGAILLGLALIPAIGQAVYYRDRISWQSPVAAADEVTVSRAQSWGRTAMWVDARPDEQFTAAHVPGAVLLNEERWDELLPPLLATWSPDKRIVVYCSSQGCGASREVARRLRAQAGLKNVFVLQGGWEAWVKGK